MKFILGTILAFILLASMFTQGIQAEGGNAIWLTKTKRGIDISCPTGYIYEEKLNYNCVKRGDTSFLVSLTYDDLVIEEEFFNEKDIMKQAILVVKLAGDTKILEKKSSSWFDKITAEIKYEINGIKGFQRMIVFNDGTVITMNFLTNSNIGVADKILSNHVKILDPNKVKEIEKKNAQYAKQAQEKANLKQAEQDKKDKEAKVKAEPTKKIGDSNVASTKTKLLEKIQAWEIKLEKLHKRYDKASLTYYQSNRDAGFSYLEKSISEFGKKINLINADMSSNQIADMVKNSEARISANYDFVDGRIRDMEYR